MEAFRKTLMRSLQDDEDHSVSQYTLQVSKGQNFPKLMLAYEYLPLHKFAATCAK